LLRATASQPRLSGAEYQPRRSTAASADALASAQFQPAFDHRNPIGPLATHAYRGNLDERKNHIPYLPGRDEITIVDAGMNELGPDFRAEINGGNNPRNTVIFTSGSDAAKRIFGNQRSDQLNSAAKLRPVLGQPSARATRRWRQHDRQNPPARSYRSNTMY
jgi:hypothetical protein